MVVITAQFISRHNLWKEMLVNKYTHCLGQCIIPSSNIVTFSAFVIKIDTIWLFKETKKNDIKKKRNSDLVKR